MSHNKRIIEAYMQAFAVSDHDGVLGCLTDDVKWIMPGFFDLEGKAAFDAEIENPAFTGRPEIRVTRLIEENDVVVAEGSVRATHSDGKKLDAVFCDVFEMRDGKISKLISYVMDLAAKG